MATPDSERTFTRRTWLGLAAAPALATAGASLLSPSRLAAEPASPADSDAGARVYNVRAFGAKGDGQTLDSGAVQAAVDACTKDGGGTVLVPGGRYLIGPVELKDNVTLHLAASAVLLGSTDGALYKPVEVIPLEGDSTLGDGNHALLFATNARNVTIEGPGQVDGQGAAFFSPVRGQLPPAGISGNNRPYLMLFYRCENLTVRNIELQKSAYHCLRVIQSKYVWMDSIHMYNRLNRNADGFHFISAEHVTVSNCHIESQDDACALFGSCKFILVTNSSFSTRWSVFRFGGGEAENVTVSNCLLWQVFGCPIKLHCMPGSRFENFSFSNLVLNEVTGPINISEGHGGNPQTHQSEYTTHHRKEASGPSIVRNLSFSNIHGTVTTNPPQLPGVPFQSDYNPGEKASCISLSAVGDAVLENIGFDNIHLTFGGGGTAEQGARRDIPELSGEYFAWGPLPAYGLYARNARGLTLSNIRFQVASQELRPAVVLDHVEDLFVNGLSVEADAQAEAVVRMTGVKQALLTATRLLKPSPTFLQLEGPDNAEIVVEGGDLSRAAAPLSCNRGAVATAVRLKGQ